MFGSQQVSSLTQVQIWKINWNSVLCSWSSPQIMNNENINPVLLIFPAPVLEDDNQFSMQKKIIQIRSAGQCQQFDLFQQLTSRYRVIPAWSENTPPLSVVVQQVFVLETCKIYPIYEKMWSIYFSGNQIYLSQSER